jgi:N-acetyl-anhydromuramyl-L-alanine amidase AmpD
MLNELEYELEDRLESAPKEADRSKYAVSDKEAELENLLEQALVLSESGQTLGPVLSPLANAQAGLRGGSSRRTLPFFGVCVHTTGSGPATRAQQDPRKSAVEYALDYYLRGGEGFPHYLVGYDGAIIAICDERNVAWHAGWKGGRRRWTAWTPPSWWANVWIPRGISTPADLLPAGANSPNDAHVGIELLGEARARGFPAAQYSSLARLIADLDRRHNLQISAAPSPKLLGHEDVEPISRSNQQGGWDPGAHRDVPLFSWNRLWAEFVAQRGGVSPAPAPPLPMPTPGTAAARPILRRGARGVAVRELQTRLTGAGLSIRVDGIFGPRTEAAVRSFQRAQRLRADGVVGPQTWQRLIRL